MKQLSSKLMWLMLGSLGITQEDIKWAGPNEDFKGANAAIQLNSYPTCPDLDQFMGLAALTDSTLLTILYQNITSGLQVHQDGSGWVTVPPVPGAPSWLTWETSCTCCRRVVPEHAPTGCGEPDPTPVLRCIPLWSTGQRSDLTTPKPSGPSPPSSVGPSTSGPRLSTSTSRYEKGLKEDKLEYQPCKEPEISLDSGH
ncbi:Gibberellin 3-beta-dioxygenase [Actinidia chinensis var. chinensis]|uniref:Gibberellin 3-beta-dioxygenase n=1 Tax=Actinidia chinensis var. chinensis TaxID=1590841 RepID=A0A2R6QFX0_ACTCC|nr:Gibberellin 3-beta-dioxygenase [Actinidia chinensis var. chinensis]